ncbi:hypothetical protein D8Z77_03640 [Brevibacillus laterosporus]|nr:hypothetical protein D8Z77_03640 [Brevibacillus laterosporus]
MLFLLESADQAHLRLHLLEVLTASWQILWMFVYGGLIIIKVDNLWELDDRVRIKWAGIAE